MTIRIHICLVIALLGLLSCKSPEYVRNDTPTQTGQSLPFASDVIYTLAESFSPEQTGCIAIAELSVEHDNAQYQGIDQGHIIRKSIFGILSAKNYEDVPLERVDYKSNTIKPFSNAALLESLDCDALITGEILAFKNDYFVSYSVMTVEVALRLTDSSGDVLWSGRHAASNHEGAIPLSPLSLLSGIFTASTNQQNEVAFQMVDAVSRRLLATLPDGRLASKPDIELSQIGKGSFAELQDGSVATSPPEMTAGQLLVSGAYEEALAEARSDFEADDQDDTSYHIAAQASLMLGQFDQARDYALSSLANGPETAAKYASLGLAYFKTDRLDLAKASFGKAAMLEPNNAHIQFNLGLAHEADGLISLASDHYFLSGRLALDSQDLVRVQKNMVMLKRLSKNHIAARKSYQHLGRLIGQALQD